jgi:hypothetical protein
MLFPEINILVQVSGRDLKEYPITIDYKPYFLKCKNHIEPNLALGTLQINL